MMKEYTKCFYNEKTDATYTTLKAAKESSYHPCIYRCWILDEKIQIKTLLFAYGQPMRTIKSADDRIASAIQNGTAREIMHNKFIVD